jgi:hypothetical protein
MTMSDLLFFTYFFYLILLPLFSFKFFPIVIFYRLWLYMATFHIGL